jgi:hypothetical protein
MMSHLDINQSPKRLWGRITDLGLQTASPIIDDVDLNALNAGGVTFSVLFHDFTPFSICAEGRRGSFSIKSEAIGLDNVSLKF